MDTSLRVEDSPRLRGSFRGFLLTCLAVVVFSAGCAAKRPVAAPGEPVTGAKSVAVLPFNNISGKRDAAEIVSNIFITALFRSGKFKVEEPGNIMQFMIQERVTTVGELDLEKLQVLANRFKVDSVIVGTVEEFDEGKTMETPVPVVALSARMINPKSGTIVWSAQNKRKGDDYIVVFDFGRVRSITTLTKRAVDEMIKTIQ